MFDVSLLSHLSSLISLPLPLPAPRRMFWAKQLLRWCDGPEAAFDTALRLNDTYQLDGRDPNGNVGIAWCFGNHDRPYPQRPVFGAVRPMTAAGLRAKKNVSKYVPRILAVCNWCVCYGGCYGVRV